MGGGQALEGQWTTRNRGPSEKDGRERKESSHAESPLGCMGGREAITLLGGWALNLGIV